MTKFDGWIALMGRALPVAIALMLGLRPALADNAFTRAVYCSAVLRVQIEASRRMISELDADRSLKTAQRQQAVRTAQQLDQQYMSDFNRLREYANSQTHPGDIDQYVSFMDAQKQGERDIEQCEKEKRQFETCLDSCTSKCRTGDISCIQGCDRQCGASTCASTNGCGDTSFLPK